MSAYVMLFALLIIGYLNKNTTVTYASLILLIIKTVFPVKALEFFNVHGMNWGIILLTAGMFAPIALGNITYKQILDSFRSLEGGISIAAGLMVAIFGTWGVESLKNDPAIVVAITVGTVLGVAFFKGLPVGPVIATGMVYGILKVFKAIAGFIK